MTPERPSGCGGSRPFQVASRRFSCSTSASTARRRPWRRTSRASLRRDRLVNRELVDVGRRLRLDAHRRERFGNACREGVEVRTRLPKVHDSPTTLYGPGCMEEESFWRRSIRIDLIVALVELLLGDPQELHADADSHLQPRFRLGNRLYALTSWGNSRSTGLAVWSTPERGTGTAVRRPPRVVGFERIPRPLVDSTDRLPKNRLTFPGDVPMLRLWQPNR